MPETEATARVPADGSTAGTLESSPCHSEGSLLAMNLILVAAGVLILVSVLAGMMVYMARISGWRVTVVIWSVSAVVTAIVVVGAFLIGAGTP